MALRKFVLQKLNRPNRGAFVVLAVALLASLVIYPQMYVLGVPLIVAQLLSRLTIVCALFAAFPPRRWFLGALAVLCLATVINCVSSGQGARETTLWLEIGVLVYVIARIMAFVFRGGISVNAIFAGVCVYLLIGRVFGLTFILLSAWQGHSVLLDADGRYASQEETFYFSYTALTTTGFGDIRPATVAARSLTIVEALTGQLYLVLLLGRLVGLHVSQSEKEKREPGPENGQNC